MKHYVEDLWRGLPQDLEPPDFDARRELLLREIHGGEPILDLGCGDGRFSAELVRHGAEVTGADLSETALGRARLRAPAATFLTVEEEAPLPFADNAFELVWAGEVIEHIADTGAWLSEVRRVLRPAGRLLLSTPDHGRLRLLLGGIERYSPPLGDHLHLYTGRSLGRLLREFGFGQVHVLSRGGPPLLRRWLWARAVR